MSETRRAAFYGRTQWTQIDWEVPVPWLIHSKLAVDSPYQARWLTISRVACKKAPVWTRVWAWLCCVLHEITREERSGYMRAQLADLAGQRLRFTGRVERFGKKSGGRGPAVETLLVREICHDGQAVADHLWFTAGVWSAALRTGHLFAFDARVENYNKGYQGRKSLSGRPRERDYGLARPSKVEILAPLPSDK